MTIEQRIIQQQQKELMELRHKLEAYDYASNYLTSLEPGNKIAKEYFDLLDKAMKEPYKESK